MNDPIGALLLVVFAVHLPIFALRWRRTREVRFAATTLTFALLVAAYAFRVFAPGLAIGARPAHELVRAVALATAAVSIGMLAWHGIRRIAKRRY